MGSGSDLTKDQFDSLLAWLDSDREVAGAKLLQICASLERFFSLKGALETSSLADETVNRVAMRLGKLDSDKTLNPPTVFWGFARNVFLESLPEIKRAKLSSDSNYLLRVYVEHTGDEIEDKHRYLEVCLSKLSDKDSEMIQNYYNYDPGKRREARRTVADKLSISIGNLQVRVFRIRELLKKCIKKCISEN